MSTLTEWARKITMIWRAPDRVKAGISHRAREAKKKLLLQLPDVTHAGNRAVCRKVELDGETHIRKVFSENEEALACMTREIAARELFGERPWMVPIIEQGASHITLALLPEERRLDRVAESLSEQERLEVARQAMHVAFEIFAQGYAHRDFHSRNMFWEDAQLRIVDFEVLQPYLEHDRPAFPESYDLVGTGLDSPFATENMCYQSVDPNSLLNTLRVPLDVSIRQLEDDLRDRLREASLTFKKRGTRHTCRAQRIYNSMELPHFSVSPSEAQRNCALRFRTLGINAVDIEGKRLLDLGSNIGGMLLEAQRLGPRQSIGIEYDAEKIELSRTIAAYNGFNSLEFRQADIDLLEAQDLGEPFDTVFCFAIEAHVKKPERLFRLLAEVTATKLYFEGNSSTAAEAAEASLRAVGFKHVESLGMCDDDFLPENNNRPLLVAIK
ncbi:MAG: methyltransferase domain-containing protein [Pseudomonadota bacterium]